MMLVAEKALRLGRKSIPIGLVQQAAANRGRAAHGRKASAWVIALPG
jgi:hypothetical protein